MNTKNSYCSLIYNLIKEWTSASRLIPQGACTLTSMLFAITSQRLSLPSLLISLYTYNIDLQLYFTSYHFIQFLSLHIDVAKIRISIMAHGDYCDGQKILSKIDFHDKSGKDKLVDFVRTVPMTGGGDYPEAYEYGMSLTHHLALYIHLLMLHYQLNFTS